MQKNIDETKKRIKNLLFTKKRKEFKKEFKDFYFKYPEELDIFDDFDLFGLEFCILYDFLDELKLFVDVFKMRKEQIYLNGMISSYAKEDGLSITNAIEYCMRPHFKKIKYLNILLDGLLSSSQNSMIMAGYSNIIYRNVFSLLIKYNNMEYCNIIFGSNKFDCINQEIFRHYKDGVIKTYFQNKIAGHNNYV